MSVSAVSRAVGIPMMVASQYLRALNARGLIEGRRQGKWVYYRPHADRSVRGARALLNALSISLVGARMPAGAICRQATGFTHPRRIEIVCALDDGPMTKAELSRRTRINRFALRRHLRKLVERGFVAYDGKRYLLTRPRHIFPATLLNLAAGR